MRINGRLEAAHKIFMEISLFIMEKSWNNHGILILNFCGNPEQVFLHYLKIGTSSSLVWCMHSNCVIISVIILSFRMYMYMQEQKVQSDQGLLCLQSFCTFVKYFFVVKFLC